MIFDRFKVLTALSFIKPAIPKAAETGKNCLFVRVEGDNLIFIGGGNFVTKKAPIQSLNTIEESGKNKKLPKTFMIPRADLFAFKEMMEEHKADCKKLAKNDPSYLAVEITDTELISHDGKIVYEQPRFEFKDLESIFEIIEEPVSGIPMTSADVISAMSGFSKSDPVQVTFSGERNLIHFRQGDYEAVVLPPVEKLETDTEIDLGDDQTKIDD